MTVAALWATGPGDEDTGSISVHPSRETSQITDGASQLPRESGMMDAIGYCLRRRTSVPTKMAASPDRNFAASAYEPDTLARNEGSVGGVQWING